MKWLSSWIYKHYQKGRDYNEGNLVGSRPVAVREDSLSSHGMNFTVYRASGGHVIEHRVYDRKQDRNNTSLHVITDDKDLGEEIGKIITFESLRS